MTKAKPGKSAKRGAAHLGGRQGAPVNAVRDGGAAPSSKARQAAIDAMVNEARAQSANPGLDSLSDDQDRTLAALRQIIGVVATDHGAEALRLARKVRPDMFKRPRGIIPKTGAGAKKARLDREPDSRKRRNAGRPATWTRSQDRALVEFVRMLEARIEVRANELRHPNQGKPPASVAEVAAFARQFRSRRARIEFVLRKLYRVPRRNGEPDAAYARRSDGEFSKKAVELDRRYNYAVKAIPKWDKQEARESGSAPAPCANADPPGRLPE